MAVDDMLPISILAIVLLTPWRRRSLSHCCSKAMILGEQMCWWRHIDVCCGYWRLIANAFSRSRSQSAQVEFIDENGGGAGVRLRKQHQNKS
jgi:hypothetical protein